MKHRSYVKISLSFISLLFLGLSGCAAFSYTNIKMKSPVTETRATFCVAQDRGKYKEDKDKKALVILSLSGGGSRAAYWSSSVMLKLEEVFSDINILEEVDILSSVSGGSLPAAYYVMSRDAHETEARSGRRWDRETVHDLMRRNYRSRWLWNWLWPYNIFKYWFTAYDRSDIMAQTFSDNMFDVKNFGYDLSFRDANRQRPYLVINATNGTEYCFSDVFTFTHDDFLKINSDIGDYDVGRAVMASASFPSAFNYMTLRDFESSERKYVHVFDAGNADNLGLTSVEKIIDVNKHAYNRIIVILVDAYTVSKGVNRKDYDARHFVDYFVDFNFLDGINTLMNENRNAKIEHLTEKLRNLNEKESPQPDTERGQKDKKQDKCLYRKDVTGSEWCDSGKTAREGDTPYDTIFYHIKFDDVGVDPDNVVNLQDRLNAISTDFRITNDGAKAIDEAVDRLIVNKNSCLCSIRDMLAGKPVRRADPYCTWQSGDKGHECM